MEIEVTNEMLNAWYATEGLRQSLSAAIAASPLVAELEQARAGIRELEANRAEGILTIETLRKDRDALERDYAVAADRFYEMELRAHAADARLGAMQSSIRYAENALGGAWLTGGASLADGIRRKCAKLEEMASSGHGAAEGRAKRVAKQRAEARMDELEALREASLEGAAQRARVAFYAADDAAQQWTLAGESAAWLRVARAIAPVPERVEVTREVAERAWDVHCRTTGGDAIDAMRAALRDFIGNSSAKLTGSPVAAGNSSETPNSSPAADVSFAEARAHVVALLNAMMEWGREGDGVPEGGVVGRAFDAAENWLLRLSARGVAAPASPSPESADRVQAQIAGLVRAVRGAFEAASALSKLDYEGAANMRALAEQALKEVERG